MDAFKKIVLRMLTPSNDCFSWQIDEQSAYLRSFSQPIDDIERSFFQYRCQGELAGLGYRIRMNIVSFFMFWVYYILIPRSKALRKEQSAKAIFYGAPVDFSNIPQSLVDSYSPIVQVDYRRKSLQSKDRKIVLDIIKRYPFSWYFSLKCLLKIALYRYQIDCFFPDIIITTSEYSFTSSVLTMLCEKNGIKHINVMHGEKLFYIRDSFFRFHKCYVWDEHYKNLFIDLRAESTQFVVEIPPIWKQLNSGNTHNIEKTIDYTYYLQFHSERELIKIRDVLSRLQRAGYSVAMRPHPVYSKNSDIVSIFNGIIIEDNNAINIDDSILRTSHVISLYSTVLTQALANNVPVIIDDVTNHQKYIQLKRLRYICMNKTHSLLSDVLLDVQGKENSRGKQY